MEPVHNSTAVPVTNLSALAKGTISNILETNTSTSEAKNETVLKPAGNLKKLNSNVSDVALDIAQLWKNWDRQNRFRYQRYIRVEMKKLNKQEGKSTV